MVTIVNSTRTKLFFIWFSFFGVIKCSSEVLSSLENSPYGSCAFLVRIPTVQKRLMFNDHFHEVYFKARDQVLLNGLLRIHAHASATIIVVGGWWPGRKELHSILVPMLPESQFNILLMDARGHGKSSGASVWRSFSSFAEHEYNDIIGAIEFAHRTLNKPIIVWGTSAGAFYAVHALLALTQEKKIAELNVKGLIFDSGWASRLEVIHDTSHGYIKKLVPRFLQKPLFAILCAIYCRIIQPIHMQQEKKLNLYDKIHLLTVPVFYIHAINDVLSSIDHVKKLYEKTSRGYCWWIENSLHAFNHCSRKTEYCSKLINFCVKNIN